MIYIANCDSKLYGNDLNKEIIKLLSNNINAGTLPGTVFANDKLHVNGCNENDKHFVYDEKNITNYKSGKQTSCSSIYINSTKSNEANGDSKLY